MATTPHGFPAPAAAPEIPPSMLAEMTSRPTPASADEMAALRRLIAHAKRDSGQSRRVADFLLAWWNAGTCGGFDLTNLWAVDAPIAQDMGAVFGLIARVHEYPPALAAEFEQDFQEIVRGWRPELEA
mgnify:CR=1 FL=1